MFNIKYRLKKKNNSIREKRLEARSWYFLRWEVGVIIMFVSIAALFNVVPVWIGNGEPTILPGGDKYAPNILRDNIAYSSISMSVTILVAIFIGIFTEIGQYIGKYSSALFALVPSIIWLLSDRGDNHIEHLVETENLLGEIIFWTIVAATGLFIISWAILKVIIATTNVLVVRMKWEAINNIINRGLIIIINIAILMMLGYALVNYGVFTLNLCEVPPEARAAHGTAYDLHSERFTTFIALVAIIFALLMVSIGLSNIFTSKVMATNDPFNTNMDERSTIIKIQEKEAEGNHLLERDKYLKGEKNE